MEANEYRVLLRGEDMLTTHDYGAAVELAREWMVGSDVQKHITLEGRMVTPWRDMEIPYPPDKEDLT